MKKFCALVIFQIAAYSLLAQKEQPANMQNPVRVDPVKDIRDYQGYKIRLIPAMPVAGNMGYGFDILKDNKPVLHQVKNPLLHSSKGVQSKDDAFEIAEWVIREYKSAGRWQTTISRQQARALKLKTIN